MASAAEIIELVRDLLLIGVLLISAVVVLLLYRSIKGLLNSLSRNVESVEEIASTISDRIVSPAAGSGVAFFTGKMFSFVQGILREDSQKEGEGSDGK